MSQIRTLFFYFLIPGISAVTPLLVYPALTFRFGEEGFASVAIAQSLGSAGAVIAELGWGVIGPQRIARADRAGRTRLYGSALATKGLAVLIIAPLAGLAASLIVSDHQVAAAILASATVTMALSPSWYLVGANRPLTILYTEGIPRTVLLIGAAIAIAVGAPLELYGIATFLAVACTLFLVWGAVGERPLPTGQDFREGGHVIREQLPLTFGRMISVIYTSLPVAIVGIVYPSAVPVFGAVERLMRMALNILSGVPSRLQSWIGVVHGEVRIRRSRQSILINLALGLVSAVGFALLAPLVAKFVFAGQIDIPLEISALSASVLLAICASRGFGLSLVAEGRSNWIAAANVAGAIVGVATVFTLASAFGAAGAILGELSAEVAGLLVQAIILFYGHRWIHRRDDFG
jgi:O-antigen/teichoic acid export membrane protein